ncbi:S-adenosyl-L-methionine-dependent methyltransferase [Mytilinidion resinicola]|uniref:S-adenosyl-L-methionine-dependent methyltransferase n=1 Tax=Mytilinidion resinicola TaxID=574789 RepID=A0A6A6XZI4_9PEZI|nr:S-adenosyl-L-methionine-dependent methyltransferase [Mytilinidion resinicola]KAF2801932.1 S-adenosyl-L-methionine-dependent methyltransferase [Mytilinidion resinicola]
MSHLLHSNLSTSICLHNSPSPSFALSPPHSITTSLSSSITAFRHENGRRYHNHGDGLTYPLPNDTDEINRLELQHKVWEISLNKRLYLAPLPPTITSVLDIGCGTGIWCIEFADAHPDVQVLGIDLSPIQPSNVPPNCRFLVDDANAAWAFPEKFDFIHTRALNFGVKDWDALLAQAFEHLAPGGWIELDEFHVPLECDDGSAAADSAVLQWGVMGAEAVAKIGTDARAALRHGERLREVGFVEVHEQKMKWPIGPWAAGEKEKKMGQLFLKDMSDGAPGLSVKLLNGLLGWEMSRVDAFIERLRAEMWNPKGHILGAEASIRCQAASLSKEFGGQPSFCREKSLQLLKKMAESAEEWQEGKAWWWSAVQRVFSPPNRNISRPRDVFTNRKNRGHKKPINSR